MPFCSNNLGGQTLQETQSLQAQTPRLQSIFHAARRYKKLLCSFFLPRVFISNKKFHGGDTTHQIGHQLLFSHSFMLCIQARGFGDAFLFPTCQVRVVRFYVCCPSSFFSFSSSSSCSSSSFVLLLRRHPCRPLRQMSPDAKRDLQSAVGNAGPQ